ncbi:MAG: alanine racemase [Eubacteriales bacterium]|nr:alanine racemase [Clostridiales bacterium]MDY3308003.1 alanine racemase [Eubacteriales bacterium]
MYEIADKARSWAEIDLSALKHNFEYASKRIGRKVICVLKADAYGHGAVECGLYLQKCGAYMFAVAALTEAVAMRKSGITIPIMILGYTSPEYAEILSDFDIEQAIVDEEHAIAMNKAAAKLNKKVKVHIALDTGMSRIGIYAQKNHTAAADAAERIYRMSNLDVVGMFTHFAAADEPEQTEYTMFQYRNFSIVYNRLIERGIRIKNCHVSNSAAILNSPIHFDSIRLGISLYGMYPDSKPVKDGPLKPVMSLKARVTQTRTLPQGATISYGRTFTTRRTTHTAVISAGYADGFSRRLSNKATVTINGKRYPQIGRICMDVCMADVTDGYDEPGGVRAGDEVTIIGDGGMSAEEAAQIVGTINYELTCLITNRVKRIYVNG